MPMPKNSNDVISAITFQTLVCPAKLAVKIFQSFHDRMAQTNTLLSLATLIKECTRDLSLAASWEEMSLNCPPGEQKRIRSSHREHALAGLFLHACSRLSNHKCAHLAHNTTNSTSPRNFEMICIFDKSFLTN
jgi:hypothetical protein